jgi:hypothetical protein
LRSRASLVTAAAAAASRRVPNSLPAHCCN